MIHLDLFESNNLMWINFLYRVYRLLFKVGIILWFLIAFSAPFSEFLINEVCVCVLATETDFDWTCIVFYKIINFFFYRKNFFI